MPRFLHPDGSVTADFNYLSTDGPYQELLKEGFKVIDNDDAVDAGTSNVVPLNDAERCSANTHAGDRCKKKAIDGSPFCLNHQPKLSPVADSADDSTVEAE